MLSRRQLLVSSVALVACHSANGAPSGPEPEPGIRDLPAEPGTVTPVTRTDTEWQALLSGEAYRVLRKAGTEMAFTGRYWDEHRKGRYDCAGCGLALFRSDDKFESGTGWPSFVRPIADGRVSVATDTSHGMVRDEVVCARCAGHLGHVFDDGPPPTGKRFCMNSVSLVFRAGV